MSNKDRIEGRGITGVVGDKLSDPFVVFGLNGCQPGVNVHERDAVVAEPALDEISIIRGK